eukprot:1805821-Amphidinium_carterae.1
MADIRSRHCLSKYSKNLASSPKDKCLTGQKFRQSCLAYGYSIEATHTRLILTVSVLGSAVSELSEAANDYHVLWEDVEDTGQNLNIGTFLGKKRKRGKF